MLKNEIKQNFKDLIDLTKKYNKLLKQQEESIFDRTDILLLGMSLIESNQNMLLEYYFKYVDIDKNIPLDPLSLEDRINFDYKNSDYANKYYSVCEKIIQEYEINDYEYDAEFLLKIQTLKKLKKKMLEISARWFSQRFIEVYEYDKQPRSKKLPKRLPLLKEAFFFTDRMLETKMGIIFEDGIMPLKGLFSVQPNSGKSFVCNVFCVRGLVLHKIYFKSSGIIRMTNTGKNALGFSGQCKNMLSDKKIVSIYPELTKYFTQNGKCTLFKREPLEEWLLADLGNEIRASMFAVGRDSAINGMRNDVALVIDDLSDGFEQMNNDQAHKDMVTKYDVDIDSRKEDENVPELFVGTMFNEFDVLNTLIERAITKYGKLVQLKDKKGNIIYPNSYLTPDYKQVFILVDCFNEKGESLAPKLITTEKLIEKQENMKPYEFDLVYRQKRTSREPRLFEYNTLITYDNIDNDFDTTICVLDPTRKNSSDYFVMSVFNKTGNNRYRFIDCICKQKSLGKLNDPKNKFANEVADFLIKYHCTHLYIENNVSNLIGSLFENLLKSKGYTFCKIEEVYNTKSKIERILNMETTIKNHIEFPRKNLFPRKHDMFIAMEQLTRFDATNINQKGNFDDVPDNIAMFAKKFIFEKPRKTTADVIEVRNFLK